MKFRNENLNIESSDPFANDALGRRPLVEFLEGLIQKSESSLVLAIDSPWGTGKTTLVKMLQAKLEIENFRCVYFNAWAVDYSNDPLMALVSKVDLLGLGSSSDTKKRIKNLKSIATLVGKRGVIAAVKASTFGALDLEKEIETVLSNGAGDASSDLFDLSVKETECLAKFREELEKVVTDLHVDGYPKNLVFFVDELDRCRPNFSIELLERIKHLFDVPNVIFVLSIDKTQLEASIASLYGKGINTKEYLRRFIDLELQVPQFDSKNFVEHLLNQFGIKQLFDLRAGHLDGFEKSDFIQTFSYLANRTSMSLRAQEQCIARLALVMEQTPSDYHLYPILAATLIVIRSMNSELFGLIKSGVASTEEFVNWLDSFSPPAPGDEKICALIEAYMDAGDPDESRNSSRRQKLLELSNNIQIQSSQRLHASKILDFISSMNRSYARTPSLGYLLSKIDLVANITR
jgi:hypothetical protein